MRCQRGQFGIILGAVLVVLVLALIGLFSVCTPGEDDHSLGAIQLASHYDDGDGYGGGDYQGRDDDGGYEYRRGGYGSQGDCQSGGCGNRSRRCERSSGDCRSSFSPGPFKDSPVTICLPYSCNSGGEQSGVNRNDRRDQPPPDERER